MANEMTGMWGATDLNDLIRGLKMVLAQAEDVRACGGTLADMKAIGTCGTYEFNSIMCNYERDTTKCEGYPHVCHECDEWDNEDECECGENCPDYGSYYCDMECDGHPCSEDEPEPTDRILKDALAALDEILAEYDKRSKR